MQIRVDDVTGPEITALIHAHLKGMHEQSPPESVHALGLEKLRQPDITLWSAWEGNELLGCGALKQLDAQHGEVKSMRTVPAHLRKGVAAALLTHIISVAQQRGYTRMSLESGSMQSFDAARRLYERFGFSYCGPFADYTHDPNSVFMTRLV